MAVASRAEGPWGGAVWKAARAEVAKGWPLGLTVLTGEDIYHLDLAQALILEHLVPDLADSFGLSIVGEESITTSALVGSARSTGMFASRRVVFLRDIAGLEGDPEPLAAYAAAPPKESFLIVRAPKLDRKRKLHKALAELGRCLAFRPPTTEPALREMAVEVAAIAKSRGVKLDDHSAGFLVDVCGHDMNRIATELEKLSIWQGDDSKSGTPLDTATIRTLVAGSCMLSGWELADALTERDTDSAMAAARRLVDSGDEPIRIVGGLASRARSLLRAKAMTEAGVSGKAVVDATRAWYFRDALARGLKRYSLRELLAMPKQLLDADRSFKSRGLDKGAVLEVLVSGLTRPSPENR